MINFLTNGVVAQAPRSTGIVSPSLSGPVSTFEQNLAGGNQYDKMGDIFVPVGADLLVVVAYSVGTGYPVRMVRKLDGAPTVLTQYNHVPYHTNIYYLVSPVATGLQTDEIYAENGDENNPYGAYAITGAVASLARVDVTGVPIRDEGHDEIMTPAICALSVPGQAADFILDVVGLYIPVTGTSGVASPGQTKQCLNKINDVVGTAVSNSVAVAATNPLSWVFLNPPAAACYRGWSIKAKA